MEIKRIHAKVPDVQPICFIGDIHGCFDELMHLVDAVQTKYGYVEFVGVGDLFDRGPKNFEVYKWFADNSIAFAMGNHDDKLRRYCFGNNVKMKPELERTIEELGCDTPSGKQRMRLFFSKHASSIWRHRLGGLQVVHAEPRVPLYGSKKHFQDLGEVRYSWWYHWRGPLTIFGHYWFDEPEIVVHDGVLHAIGIDTSCCAGGGLTGFVLPHGELVTVPSKKYVDKCDSRTTLLATEKAAWEYWKGNPCS